MIRFKDIPCTLHDFLDIVLVHCPKCNEKAEVRKQGRKVGEIFCDKCGYYKKEEKVYFSLDFSRNCPNCGKRIAFKIPHINEKNKKDSMKFPCEHCGIVESYKPKYMPHYNINNLYISNGKESCFNTELWLQKACKGNNVFWATNFKHLEYLKQYIQADIRERNDFQRNMTMIAKLPKFIKSAKNRESLLKIIKQLEDK